MILSVEGEAGTAKSTLSYTQPYPIMGFNFDMGVDRAIYGVKFNDYFADKTIRRIKYDASPDRGPITWEGHDITIIDLPHPLQLHRYELHGYRDLWAYFMRLFNYTVMHEDIKSIALDTATLARRAKANDYLQELQEKESDVNKKRKQLLQIEYGHVNDGIRMLYDAVKSTGKNMVAVHHLTDEYKPQVNRDGAVESMPSGERILEGLAGTHRLVDIALRTYMTSSNVPMAKIVEKCGYNPSLIGVAVVPKWDSIIQVVQDSLGGRLPPELEYANEPATTPTV